RPAGDLAGTDPTREYGLDGSAVAGQRGSRGSLLADRASAAPVGAGARLVSLPWNSWQFWAAAESDPLGDLILAGGALGFIAAHYRFQGLVHHIVPPDGRARSSDTKKGKKDGAVSESWPVRRSDRLVDSREVATLLLSLPIWAALGLAAFLLLPGSWTG